MTDDDGYISPGIYRGDNALDYSRTFMGDNYDITSRYIRHFNGVSRKKKIENLSCFISINIYLYIIVFIARVYCAVEPFSCNVIYTPPFNEI